jgi:hypothetical protein
MSKDRHENVIENNAIRSTVERKHFIFLQVIEAEL